MMCKVYTSYCVWKETAYDMLLLYRQEGTTIKFDCINLNSSVQWFTEEDYSSKLDNIQ